MWRTQKKMPVGPKRAATAATALPVGYSSPRAWGLAALRCEARGVHPNTRLVPTVSSPVNYAISHHEQHGRRYARCSCGASINEWIILSGLVCPRCAPSGATKNDHKHVSVYFDSSVDKLSHRARLLQARKPNAPAEWMQKLPQMARRLEESLFRSALSFVSYSGMCPRVSEF